MSVKKSIINKTLSWLISLSMILTLIPFSTLTVSASVNDDWNMVIWDGETTNTDWVGDGSESDPYQIHTAEDLAGLAKMVNEGERFDGKYFIQTDSIDLGNFEWTPIGDNPSCTDYNVLINSNYFAGDYDGQMYVIENLKISTHRQMVNGLFGLILGNAVIKNIMVTGDISYTAENVSVYEAGIGGIVGLAGANTLISGCVSTINVDVAVLANDNNHSMNIGGIVGCTNGIVRNCFNIGDFTVNYAYNGAKPWQGLGGRIGGIAGRADGLVENCYVINSTITGNCAGGTNGQGNYGVVDIGGIVGFSEGSNAHIRNCFAASTVTGDSANATVGITTYNSNVVNSANLNLGGVVGRLFNSPTKISDCYYTAESAYGSNSGTATNCIKFTDYGTLESQSAQGSTADLLATLNAWISSQGEADYYGWKQESGEYPVFDVTFHRHTGDYVYSSYSTIDAEGNRTLTCDECGEILHSEITPTIGFNYTSLPSGAEGEEYSATVELDLTYTDSSEDYTVSEWNAVWLPSGLSMNSETGEISGTTEQNGMFNVMVTAYIGEEFDQYVRKTLSLKITTQATRTKSLNFDTFKVGGISYIAVDGSTKSINPQTTNVTDSAEGWTWYYNNVPEELSNEIGVTERILVLDGLYLSLIADEGYAITLPDNSTIVLADGSVNNIKCTNGVGLNVYGSLNIKGSGQLDIKTSSTNPSSGYTGIVLNWDLTVDDGIIIVSDSTGKNPGISTRNNIIINSGSVTTSGLQGILCSSKFTMKGGTVNATGTRTGIAVGAGDDASGFEMTGGEIYAKSNDEAGSNAAIINGLIIGSLVIMGWDENDDDYTVDAEFNNTTGMNMITILGESFQFVTNAKIIPGTNAEAPNISEQPQSTTTVSLGGVATLSVTASIDDGGTLSYQWYSNITNSNNGGTLISGASGSTYSPSTTTAGTRYYYVVVTNTNNNVGGEKTIMTTSNVASVVVTETGSGKPTPTTSDLNYTLTDGIVYDKTQKSVTITPKAGVGTVTVKYNGSTTAPTNAGTYIVTVDVTEGTTYASTTGIIIGSLTISKIPLTITAVPKSKSVGEADPALTYDITSGSLLAGDTLTGGLTRRVGETVGVYAIISTFANPNYAIVYEGSNLTITSPDEDDPEAPTGGISGTVTDNSGLGDITVRVELGNKIVASTIIDSVANPKTFSFTELIDGFYNVVVDNGFYKTTRIVEVMDGQSTSGIIMELGRKQSVVEVKPADSGTTTPDVVVGGLDNLFPTGSVTNNTTFTDADKLVVDAGGSVEIKLIATGKKEENVTVDANKIKNISAGKTLNFIDFTVEKKQIDNTGSQIGNSTTIPVLESIIKIVFPIPSYAKNASGIKSGLAIYRVHSTTAATIPQGETNKNLDGEYFEIIGDNIILHVKKFSTYAIGYTDDTNGGNKGGNGGSGGVVIDDDDVTVTDEDVVEAKEFTVTYKANDGGTILDMPSDIAKYDTGNTVTVKGTPISTSKFFKGWNTKADGTGTVYAVGNTLKITGDITLYAQWKNKYTSSTKLVYKVTGKNQVSCIGTSNSKATTISIPNTVAYKGIIYKVTGIAKKAFYGNKVITSVKIGNNVKTVGSKAFFKCTNLKKVTMGTGLVTLEDHVFCHAHEGCIMTINSKKLKTVKTAANHGVNMMVVNVPKSKINAYKKLFAKSSKSIDVKEK